VANFLQYVKSGFYKGTIFHRVIDGFMIQAGGMDAKLGGRATRKPIKSEANNGLSNVVYSVAMAREANPDARPRSSSSTSATMPASITRTWAAATPCSAAS
jgi:peptidyl-prolyl cis-trans isomerase A (cyclophilin A)